MRFNFCTANHTTHGRKTLGEMYSWFSAGLLDAGHEVSLSEEFVDFNSYNVFWEHFPPGFGQKLRDCGVPYGIIATEIPDGHGFNWRREEDWVARWEGFAEAASGASFIWTTVEHAVSFYSSFAPTRFIEFGYSKRLEPKLWTRTTPSTDFCFYGLRTPYRLEVVAKLEEHARVDWPEVFLSDRQVNFLLQRSRVCLNFKQSEHWPIPSPTRLGRVLHARRWAASEFTERDTQQSRLFGMCPRDIPFHEYCLHTLEIDLEGKNKAAFETFKREMPMGRIMSEAIRELRPIDGTKRANQRKIIFPLPPERQKDFLYHSVVYFDRKYFAIDHRLGALNLQDKNIKIGKYINDLSVLTAPNLFALKAKVFAKMRLKRF